jgi:redox-sensitive bicupin YhaK (pirin superfamily)
VTKPRYQTRSFTDDKKLNRLCAIVTPEKERSPELKKTLKIRNDLSMYASLLEKDVTLTHSISANRLCYIQVVSTKSAGKLLINGDVTLAEGDGAFIDSPMDLTIVGKSTRATEFVLFDMARNATNAK